MKVDWKNPIAVGDAIEIPSGFIKVKRDGWLRRALALYDKRKCVYRFYFNPDTRETLVRRIALVWGQWSDTLYRIDMRVKV